jgi:hypothetical protein
MVQADVCIIVSTIIEILLNKFKKYSLFADGIILPTASLSPAVNKSRTLQGKIIASQVTNRYKSFQIYPFIAKGWKI